MHGHQKSWGGHKDEEEVVVTDVFAAGLLRVAGEDGDAEDEENRQPYLSQAGRVFVHSSQLVLASLVRWAK
uniref:Uncharacterized protein n=1 Tax=Pygocentrus nattereri TaxID=42514 RepID=A0AAR2LH61_PYGNA